MKTRSLVFLVAPLAVAAVLTGCSTGSSDPTSTAEPSPEISESTTPSESDSPSEQWQTVTVSDGTTFEIPADWTTDEQVTDEQLVTVTLSNAAGSTVLEYGHELVAPGGFGGSCVSQPEITLVEQWTGATNLTSENAGTIAPAAYTVEQSSGVTMWMGYVDVDTFASNPCAVYNMFLGPDGNRAWFSSTMMSTSDLEGTGSTAETGDPMWDFASVDDATAFVNSADGEIIVQVLQSLEMAQA